MGKLIIYSLQKHTTHTFCNIITDFPHIVLSTSEKLSQNYTIACVYGDDIYDYKKQHVTEHALHVILVSSESELQDIPLDEFDEYLSIGSPAGYVQKKIRDLLSHSHLGTSFSPHMKLVEQLEDSVIILDSQGMLHEVNPHFLEVTEYAKEEVLQKHISQFFPDTDFNSLIQKCQTESVLLETVLRKKTNIFVPKEIRLTAVQQEQNHIYIVVARDIRERLKAMKKIEESEERFRTIIKHSPNGMIIFKNDVISYINLCGIEILKGNYEDFIDQSFIKLVSEAHKETISKILKNKKRGAVSRVNNVILLTKTGNEARVNISCIPVYIQDEIHHFILFQDITEQQKVLFDLQRTDIRLREIQKIAKLGHWEHNIIKNNLYWSDEVYKIYGVTPQEFNPSYDSVLRFVHTDDRETVRNAYQNSLKTREPYEIVHRILLHDGTIKYINEKCSTIFDEHGNPLRSLGTVMDITHTIKTEKALKQTEKQFQLLFENLDQPFLICKPKYGMQGDVFDFEISDVNPACKNLFYGNYKEVVGRTILEIFHDPYFWIQKYTEALQSSETVSFRKYSTDLQKYLDIILYPIKDTNQIAGIYTDVTQKVYAENQLQQLTARLQQIQEYAKIGFYDVNNITRYSKWSSVMISIFEFPLDVKPSFDIFLEKIHPDDRDHVRYVYAQSIKQKEHEASLEYRLLFADGRIKYIYTEFTNTFEGKTCLKTQGWLQDVTDLRSAVTALRESEEKLRMVTSGTKLGLWEWDLQQKEFVLDHIGASMLGFVPEEIWGDQGIYLSLIHEEDRLVFNKVLKRFYRSQQNIFSIEYRIKTKNNRFKWISSVGIALEHNEYNQPTKIIGFNQDISSRKKVESELRESENKFRRIFEIENDSLFLVDIKSHEILEVNNAVFDLYGYTRKELIKRNFYSLSTNPQRLYSYIAKRTTRINNEHALLKNGDICPVELSLAYFIWKGKQVMLAAVRDISERHRFQQELVYAKEKAEESDRLKSAFLANMSHEIRTPLNAIVGFSRLLARKNYEEEKRKLFINDIQANSNQLLTIINDILDISKIESGQFILSVESVCINKVLQELYDSFSVQLKDKEISLLIDTPLPDADVMIEIDEVRLKQVISNLLHNAIKFTEKGFVRFGYYIDKETDITFFVEDTGIGISPEKHSVIFEHFRQEDDTTTRKYGGTGLGLSISRRLLQLMNGRIWLESEKGKGATFFVSVPYTKTQESSLSTTPQTTHQKSIFNGEHILVCDDVISSFVFISEMFENEDVRIIQAKSGEEAIQICNEHGAINLVLMDIQMAGLNGIDAMREIKKMQPHIPVIAQTAFAQKGDKERFLAEGFDDYLTKPLDERELHSMLKKFLK